MESDTYQPSESTASKTRAGSIPFSREMSQEASLGIFLHGSVLFVFPLVFLLAILACFSSPVFGYTPVNQTYYLKDGQSPAAMVLDTSAPTGQPSSVSVAGGSTESCTTYSWLADQAYHNDTLIPPQSASFLIFADSTSQGGGSASISNLRLTDWSGSADVQTLASSSSPSCSFYGNANGFSCTFSVGLPSGSYVSAGDYVKLYLDLCAKKVTASLRYNSTSRNSGFSMMSETAAPLVSYNWTFVYPETATVLSGNDVILRSGSPVLLNLTETELGAANDTNRRIYLKYRKASDSAWTQLPDTGDSNFGLSSLTPANPSGAFSVAKNSHFSIIFNITPKSSGEWVFNATPDSSPISVVSGQAQNFSVGKKLSFHWSAIPAHGTNLVMNESPLYFPSRSSGNSGSGTFFSSWIQSPPESEGSFGGINITGVRFTFYENSTSTSKVSYVPSLYKTNSTSSVLIGSCPSMQSISTGVPAERTCSFTVSPPYTMSNSENASLNATIAASIGQPGFTYSVSYDGNFNSFVFMDISYLPPVSNSPPNISIPSIIPSSPTTLDSLNCSAIPTDNESASLHVKFTWYVGASHLSSYDSYVQCQNGSMCYTSMAVPSNSTSLGENWTCSARSYDGTFYSDFFNSTPVTISGAPPSISSMLIDDSVPGDSSLNLFAGVDSGIWCNGTATDSSGFSGIDKINATLYSTGLSSSRDSDNRTKHYSNSSCAFSQSGTDSAHFSCSFSLAYYSVNGTWACNASVFSSGLQNHSVAYANVSELMAINVTPYVDYGDLQVGQVSGSDAVAKVQNIGNTAVDLNLFGYASSPGDNLAASCTLGNIPISLEKYDFGPSVQYSQMIPLGGNPAGMTYNLNLSPQSGNISSTIPLYWKISIPSGARGICNGIIMLSAIKS